MKAENTTKIQFDSLSINEAYARSVVAAFLAPESIGKGYGRKLFETLEADELAVRARRIWLTSSDMALDFYEHMGWVNPNGYRVRAGEENLLYMEKRK